LLATESDRSIWLLDAFEKGKNFNLSRNTCEAKRGATADTEDSQARLESAKAELIGY
jgi:hypothetical protein